ncbi:restriction endonuclease subunit S [Vibrio sp. M250220]|uniref:restriction endonuclease subunit S n=1 Tax=Vibrio sp. M250220 TaxID=3020894 RepID=UPI002F3E358D
MTVDKNVPEIRFKGFNGEWEERSLGGIGTLKNGMNFDKSAMGHGYPFVNLQDVFGKNEVSCKNLGLAFSTENQRKDYNLDEGDVLFIRSSVKPEGVGEAAVVSRSMINTTFSGFIIRFRPSIEMDVSFNRFAYSTTKCRKQILASSTSSANSNINQESLQRIRLSLPSRPEQTKIGNTFQKLDGLINQHQQKHDKLSNIKKAMLEKMFPKQGETVPEIRFKGFSGEWEEVTLGGYARFTKGQGYSKSDLSESGTPIILYGRLYTNYQTVISQVDTFAIEKSKSLKSVGNEVIVPASGESPEDIARASAVCESGVILGGDLNIIYPNDKINPVFLALVISNGYPQKELASKAQGKSVVHIRNSDLDALLFAMPKKEEQTAIGNYFQKLDTLINQHQQQITKLTNIKQACLSKMFV